MFRVQSSIHRIPSLAVLAATIFLASIAMAVLSDYVLAVLLVAVSILLGIRLALILILILISFGGRIISKEDCAKLTPTLLNPQ